MTPREQFLADIETFLKAESWKESSFGKAAIGDPNLVRQLREGRTPSIDTADKVRAFMAANTKTKKKKRRAA